MIPQPKNETISLVVELMPDILPQAQPPTPWVGGEKNGEVNAVDTTNANAANPVDNPLASPKPVEPTSLAPSPPTITVPNTPVFPALLTGRNPGDRDARLAKGGGGIGTEAAVVKGLQWLCRVQRMDGSWSLAGKFADGISPVYQNDNPTAATAMALLAFQGFGVTPYTKNEHVPEEFVNATARGWQWLLKRQQRENDEHGCFFRRETGDVSINSHRFYTHGLCTIAVCELYQMTEREMYRQAAQDAVDYCVRNQDEYGGWRYGQPNNIPDSDVSVTGWIVMALQTARAAGLTVPHETFDKVTKFLDTVSRNGGGFYIYRDYAGEGVTLAMTAEGLFCRELLGWQQDDKRLREGLDWLVEEQNLIRFDDKYHRDCYYWYYATQALHHYGGEHWKKWNAKLINELPKYQTKSGKEVGSWSPKTPVEDTWGYSSGGRLMTTCFSIYILEVYYRHVRLYEIR
jgi:hypothetical protein